METIFGKIARRIGEEIKLLRNTTNDSLKNLDDKIDYHVSDLTVTINNHKVSSDNDFTLANKRIDDVDATLYDHRLSTATSLTTINNKLGLLTLESDGDIQLADREIKWSKHTDEATIGFHNPSDNAESYLYFQTADNGNEYFRWLHRTSAGVQEWMSLRNNILRINGQTVYHTGNLPKFSWIYAGQTTHAAVYATYKNHPVGTVVSFLYKRSHYNHTSNNGTYYDYSFTRYFVEKTGANSWRDI